MITHCGKVWKRSSNDLFCTFFQCHMKQPRTICGGQYKRFPFDKIGWVFKRRIPVFQSFCDLSISFPCCNTVNLFSELDTTAYAVNRDNTPGTVMQCGSDRGGCS